VSGLTAFCCNPAHHPYIERGWMPLAVDMDRHEDDGRAPCIPGPRAFTTIVIDPPWEFRQKWQQRGKGNPNSDTHDGLAGIFKRGGHNGHYEAGIRGAAAKYRCMTLYEIGQLPVGDWAASDAHLYLWTPNAFMADACALMERWGFTYITLLTWVKNQLGMGMYYRNTTEHALFGIRGSLKTTARNVPTHIIAPRTEHSAKPGEFYRVVEGMSPGPYMDAFARKEREGWFCWGDQVEGV